VQVGPVAQTNHIITCLKEQGLNSALKLPELFYADASIRALAAASAALAGRVPTRSGHTLVTVCRGK